MPFAFIFEQGQKAVVVALLSLAKELASTSDAYCASATDKLKADLRLEL